MAKQPHLPAGTPAGGQFGTTHGRTSKGSSPVVMTSKASADEIDELQDYVQGSGPNDTLRHRMDEHGNFPGGSSFRAVQQHVEGMDALMKKGRLKSEITVHRAVDGETFERISNAKTFVDKGFVSTTKSAAALTQIHEDAGILNPVNLRIIVPRGSHAIDVNYHLKPQRGFLTDYSAQQEVILPRGSTFKVSRSGENVTLTLVNP